MALLVDDGDHHVGIAVVVEIRPHRGIAAIVRIQSEGIVDALKGSLEIGEQDVLLPVARNVKVLPAISVEIHDDDRAPTFEEIGHAKAIDTLEIDDARGVGDVNKGTLDPWASYG